MHWRLRSEPVLSFGIRYRRAEEPIAFRFYAQLDDDNEETPNWHISRGDLQLKFYLDFPQTIAWLTALKHVWALAVQALLSEHTRFGAHLGSRRLLDQMFLNWFGLPKSPQKAQWFLENEGAELAALVNREKVLSLICANNQHTTRLGSTICSRCGFFFDSSAADEEEEALADICPDCGKTGPKCKCEMCDFCGKRQEKCKCLLCDQCDYCKCDSKRHLKLHPPKPCDCGERCTSREQQIETHGQYCCECGDEAFCPGCELPVDECECDGESSDSSCEFEY